jgi:hypothetical protein
MKKVFLLLLVSLLTIGYYQDPLIMGTSPSGLATGGLYSLRADGSSAVFNQPASLLFTKTNSFRSFICSYEEDINYTNISVSQRFGNAIIAFGYAGIQIINLSNTIMNNDGVVLEGSPIPYANEVFALGVSTPISSQCCTGLTLKYYHSKIQNSNANGVDMSISTFYFVDPTLKIMFNADNIFGFTKPILWNSGLREALPTSITVGASYANLPVWLSSGVTSVLTDGEWVNYWNIGATYRLLSSNSNFNCDISGSLFQDFVHTNLSVALGLSVSYLGCKMSYAFIPSTFYEGGYRHYVGVGLDL